MYFRLISFFFTLTSKAPFPSFPPLTRPKPNRTLAEPALQYFPFVTHTKRDKSEENNWLKKLIVGSTILTLYREKKILPFALMFLCCKI